MTRWAPDMRNPKPAEGITAPLLRAFPVMVLVAVLLLAAIDY